MEENKAAPEVILEQYTYGTSAPEPAKRVSKLQSWMEENQDKTPLITAFEVGTLQADSLYANVEVTYKQYDEFFGVRKIENRK